MQILSKEKMIEDLRELAKILGKTPSSTEMNCYHKETGKGAAHSSYSDYFGNWTKALEAAGLEKPKCFYRLSDEALCEKLCKFAEKLGHTPLRRELDTCRDSNMPCSQTYIAHFGTWRDALIAAGLPAYNRCRKGITDEELLDILHRLAKEIGKTPSAYDLGKYEWAPSVSTYMRHFGSWNQALECAGFEAKKRMPVQPRLSDEERVARRKAKAWKQLEAFIARERHAPSPDDLGKKTNTPCYRTCVKYFGSWQQISETLKKII